MSASPLAPLRPTRGPASRVTRSRPSREDPRTRRTEGSDPGAPERDAWIGVDFARFRARPVSRSWVPLAMLALLAALAVAALRIDLIRTRYALADALEREQALITEQRTLIAAQRRLREPTTQAARADALGLRPAESVYYVVDPTPAGHPGSQRPAVAAGPPVMRAWQPTEVAGLQEAAALPGEGSSR